MGRKSVVALSKNRFDHSKLSDKNKESNDHITNDFTTAKTTRLIAGAVSLVVPSCDISEATHSL